MSYFVEPKNRTRQELVPGVFLRTFWGELMTAAIVDIDPNAIVPMHQHVNEQVGLVISGTLTFTIGEETRQIHPGDMYMIPGNVVHGAVGGADGAQVIEVFAPVREEYKFE